MNELLATKLLRLSAATDPVLGGPEAALYPDELLQRLLNRRVLIELAAATEWDVCPACECDFALRPIQRLGGRIVAACPLDAASDTELTESDLKSYRVDGAKLLQHLARDNQLNGEPRLLMPDLWHLGVSVVGADLHHLYFARRLQSQLAEVAGREIAARGGGTVLVADVETAELLRGRGSGVLVVDAADALLGEDPRHPFRLRRDLGNAVAAPRLQIARDARSIELDGHQVRLTEQPFKLICVLAEAARDGGVYVARGELAGRLGPGKLAQPRVVDDTLLTLRKQLRTAGVPPAVIDGLIEVLRSHGVRLRLRPAEIAIHD